MVLNGVLGQTQLSVSLKDASLTVMFDYAEALTYDRGGRLWSRFIDGHIFRRGLDGRVMEKWNEGGVRRRRWLSPAQAAALIDESAARMADLRDQIGAGRVRWAAPPDTGETIEAIALSSQFDAQAAARDRQRFWQVYSPTGNDTACVSILPPDQYLALVVQATTGCSFNTCTFCNFYAGTHFYVKPPQAFRQHVRAVREFLGGSILMRKSIFLGEANALTIPFNRLAPMLSIVSEELDCRPIHAFMDAFSGAKKSIGEYRMLASLGLKRVSIGLESGNDPLLQFVRKPGRVRDAIDTVSALKIAGLNVSVIVLIGLGGDRYAERHAADTVSALNAMPLDRDDIIYFSHLVEHADTAYPGLARGAGICALTPDEMTRQRQAIRSGLRFGPGGPTVSKYDIGEFVY